MVTMTVVLSFGEKVSTMTTTLPDLSEPSTGTFCGFLFLPALFDPPVLVLLEHFPKTLLASHHNLASPTESKYEEKRGVEGNTSLPV